MKKQDPRLLRFWNYMPDDAAAQLDPAVREAIDAAIIKANPQHSGADIRLSFGPFFLRLISGRERRSNERLKDERVANPVFTAKNLPLLLLAWGASIASAYLIILLFQRATLLLLQG